MPGEFLECVDCGKEFEFTERERDYFAQQIDPKTGQSWGPPKRCIPCRRIRKANKMNNIKQDQQRS
jgi:hypothetical protein